MRNAAVRSLRAIWHSRFVRGLSLLQRCLLASLVVHALLGFMFGTWVVATVIYRKATEKPLETSLDAEALAKEKLSLEIREQVAELEAPEDAPAERVPVLRRVKITAEPLIKAASALPTTTFIVDPSVAEVRLPSRRTVLRAREHPAINVRPIRRLQPARMELELETRRIKAEALPADTPTEEAPRERPQRAASLPPIPSPEAALARGPSRKAERSRTPIRSAVPPPPGSASRKRMKPKVPAPRKALPKVAARPPVRMESPKKPVSPFMLRDPKKRKKMLKRLGGDPKTEAAVEKALAWLAKNQEPDGRWAIAKHGGQGGHDIAGTSFALLCFFGWGQTHLEPGKYQEAVRKGVDWLATQVKEDGDLTAGRHNGMYGHGVASLALAEAYALTRDPKLRPPLDRAIDFIVKAQNPRHGGWRYKPGSAAGDTSVVGWQVMALRSAELGGLQVPGSSMDLAGKWLDRVGGGKQGGLYGYQGKSPKPAMVAEGMFSRILLGASKDDPGVRESEEYIGRHPANKDDFNFYYWYYASLALYQTQGPTWVRWNEGLKEILVTHQEGDGSWRPLGRWAGESGRLVVTAMAALSLEVYYRYLPLTLPHDQ